MDTFECIVTKLDVREFGLEKVSDETKSKILEAGRMTGTGLNTQHWRFVLVEDRENIKRLAQDSISGNWAAGANFAVIILTNPVRTPGKIQTVRHPEPIFIRSRVIIFVQSNFLLTLSHTL